MISIIWFWIIATFVHKLVTLNNMQDAYRYLGVKNERQSRKAALLASVPVNRGRMPKPWIVRTVSEEMNEIVYQGRRSGLDSPIKGNSPANN